MTPLFGCWASAALTLATAGTSLSVIVPVAAMPPTVSTSVSATSMAASSLVATVILKPVIPPGTTTMPVFGSPFFHATPSENVNAPRSAADAVPVAASANSVAATPAMLRLTV